MSNMKPLRKGIVNNWSPNVRLFGVLMLLMAMMPSSYLQVMFIMAVFCCTLLVILFYLFKLPPAPTKLDTKIVTSSIIGHRGTVQHKIDQNTLSAFQHAYDCNSSGIECDIRFTKDNVPVVVHDYHLSHLVKKEAQDSMRSINIHELTLDEIRSIKLKENDDSQIMTLDELIEFMNAHPFRKSNEDHKAYFGLLLEIKYLAYGRHNKDMLKNIAESVNQISFKNERVIVISFSMSLIYRLRKRAPNMNIGICFDRHMWYNWILDNSRPTGFKERILHRFKDPFHTFFCQYIVPSFCGCSCVMIHHSLLSAHVIQHYFDNQVAVCCWGSFGIDTKWLLSKGVCCVVDDPQKYMQF